LRSIEITPLERLSEEKYSRVLCYPEYNLEELKRRVKELEELGVWAVEFMGEKSAFDVPVLGKGCVGIVVAAHANKGKVALKIRRVDADRTEMKQEAIMLQRANVVGVGPSLLDATDNFLIMEFVGGRLLPQWVERLKGRGTRYKIRNVLRDILEQCWRLDEAGVDHGQLSKAPKHIIVDEKDVPYLVDFETASVSRRVSNVTSIAQYLFIGSQVAKKIKRKVSQIDRIQLIDALKNYKNERTRENFERSLDVCGLHKV
jgi:putative serine/threonine protein kinase